MEASLGILVFLGARSIHTHPPWIPVMVASLIILWSAPPSPRMILRGARLAGIGIILVIAQRLHGDLSGLHVLTGGSILACGFMAWDWIRNRRAFRPESRKLHPQISQVWHQGREGNDYPEAIFDSHDPSHRQ